MSDTTLPLPSTTNNTGPQVDAESLIVGANTVIRERVQTVGTTAASIAAVLNAAPGGSAYGLVVRAIIDADNVANVAHDAADSGGPNKIGGRAVASVSAQTPVAANDRTDYLAGVDGVLIVRQDCNLEDIVTGTLVNTDGASTSLIASSGSGIKTYLRSLDLYNSSGAGVVVELKDGTTVKKTFFVPTLGGLIRRFDPPLAGTAATAWNIDAGAATTTLYANAEGFRSKL